MNLVPLRNATIQKQQQIDSFQEFKQQQDNIKSQFIFTAQEPKKFIRAVFRTKSHCSYLQQDNDFKIIIANEQRIQQNLLASMFGNKQEISSDKIQIGIYMDPNLNLLIRRNITTILYNVVEEFKKIKVTKSGKIIKDIDQIAITLKSKRIRTLEQDQEKYQKQNYQNLEMYRRNARINNFNLHRDQVYQNNIQKINQKQLTKVEYPVKSILSQHKLKLLKMPQ
ncbi:hypothetical protein SS50377_27586 [Spironucleus salmonicida]|uniref:Uncharacterized protein n=1 Tax=Spironucleus salmonicida TaxID=348837 RepID=V6LPM4_9EUKA|nr:hypothetical protein SS50377_27586 [Spironucleus salmonicida]|eukprot:EST46637.1 Hypothetical protein SS50377_13440 [Spironucleus salmonicida]